MGTILAARCSCGFASGDFFAGGGMRTFETYCGAPALCTVCAAFSVLNYLDSEPRCLECGGTVLFYNEPTLQAPRALRGPEPRLIFSWNVGGEQRIFLLPDVGYRCPKCGSMFLRFVRTGHWD